MEKIKVLQLGSPSGLYGAERWILALINNLDGSQIDTSVGAILDSKELTEAPLCVEAEKVGITAHTIQSYGRFNRSAPSMLRELLLREGIDILHTHGYKTDLIGLLAVRGTQCKIVSTPHGWTNRPDIKLLCYELLDRFLFRFFDAVVPLSKDLYENLRVIPGVGKRLELIPNGVDIKEIESVGSVAGEIANWKSKGEFTLGYIGRLTHGKALDILIRSLALLKDVDWQLAIVGEGEQEHELRALASELKLTDKIQFFGFRSDRISFLKGFDVFVLPSRSEGIPRCVMEAMAAGVPVVATDIPGCRHLVINGETGLLFEKDNVEQLASVLKQIAVSSTLRADLASAGCELIHSDFSAAKMADQYCCLYESLC